MLKPSPKAIFEPIFVLAHLALYALALSIPILLALQTIAVDGDFSLERWTAAWREIPRWADLLVNTLCVGLLATTISIVAGTIFAALAFKFQWAGRGVMVIVLLLFACLPTFVTAGALLGSIDIGGALESTSIAGMILGLVHLPLASLIIGLGLLYVEAESQEAAMLEASGWAVVLRISIPRAGWSIAAAALTVFWLVVTDYSVTDVLQVRTFAEEIYTQYQLSGRRTASFILSVPMMLMLACGFFCLVKWGGRSARSFHQGTMRRPVWIELGRKGRLCAGLVLTLLLLGAGWLFFNLYRHLAGSANTWDTFRAIVPEWWNTILMAVATSLIVSGFAVSVAWLWGRSDRWRVITAVMLLGLISIPSPTLAMMLSWYFNRSDPAWLMDWLWLIYDTLWIYVLVLGLRFLPIAALVVLPAIRRLPKPIDEAARADGAGWFDRLVQLYWPECRGSALLAGLIVMILCVGELDCVHLVSPPGIETLSKRFFSFIHVGVDAQVAVVCLVSTLTAWLPAVALVLLVRKKLL